MFPLSLTTGYAVLALNCMKGPEGEPSQVASIAASMGLPGPFLAKIVNRLGINGLVRTRRGRKGGVVLTRLPEEISLEQIVSAVEGEGWDKACFLGLRACAIPEPEEHCPIHEFWVEEIGRFKVKMAGISLADLGCFDPRTSLANLEPGKKGCPESCDHCH